MENIIINADDFGLTPSVNKAIVDSFKYKYINSTTIMANMPYFDEAVQLAHEHSLVTNIGAHLVLTDGMPLTDEIKSLDFLFNANKSKKKFSSLFLLNKTTENLIFNEFSAQIEKIKKNGIAITHLDTHHHMHQYYGVAKILLRLKKKYNIPAIRILNNLEEPSRIYKKAYRAAINLYLTKNNSNFSVLFGSRNDVVKKFAADPGSLGKKSIEIMVHPDYNTEGRLIDNTDDKLDFGFVKSLNINLV